MEKIENRIVEIMKNKANESKISVFVLVGFPYQEIVKLEDKFFVDWSQIIVNDPQNQNLQENVLTSAFGNMSRKGQSFWMTYEEFVVSFDLLRHNFNFYIIDNNLYHKKKPFDGTIKNIGSIYETFYLDNDTDLIDEKIPEYKAITKFYGDITYSKETGNYYVSYDTSKYEDLEILDYFLEEKMWDVEYLDQALVSEDVYQLELTDDETVFLDLTYYLQEHKLYRRTVQILIMIDVHQLPNRYLQRTKVLQSIYGDSIQFVFTKKTIESSVIPNYDDYRGILTDYWGYDDFRDLEIYINPSSKSTETVDISQAQIINDIVEQTSHAFDGKYYRDIFITSTTGSGKSIMFQLPALFIQEKYKELNPLTIIISPLIALMNDQVDSLRSKNIDSARTIHSNIAPHERETILNEVAEGSCKMLYLSPETLQARTDIRTLIGDRILGLIIVDEAHIVSTWGKTFRADYWYLGIYLQRLRKTSRFPIVTFTATAILGGPDDMYMDIRDSLNMVNPISYFGKVKRDDIFMCISSSSSEEALSKSGRDHRLTKNQLTLEHLERAFKSKQKSLVYFTTVKQLYGFHSFLESNNSDIAKLAALYHGQLTKEEKDETLEGFKNGNIQFVFATKAFGMGVDIPDITNVYHYTPSATVTDYIQEVGRVARRHDLVSYGFAWCDFLGKRDFNEVKKLHAFSRVKNEQLIQIIQKILNLYKEKNNARNLLINADDFKYIFKETEDDDTLDNKIKISLLLIEKDYSSPNKLGFPPFAARPRGLYGNDLIIVNSEFESTLLASSLRSFVSEKTNLKNTKQMSLKVYEINLSRLWEERYKDLTYPNFKRMLYTPSEITNLRDRNIIEKLRFSTGLTIQDMEQNEINDSVYQFNNVVQAFSYFSSEKKRSNAHFSVNELGIFLQKELKSKDAFHTRSIAQSFINGAFEYQKIHNTKFIDEKVGKDAQSNYQLTNNYDNYINFLQEEFRSFLMDRKFYSVKDGVVTRFYYRSKNNTSYNQHLIVLGIAEVIGLLSFSVVNGNNPQIYIRINAINPLERVAKTGAYENGILSNLNNRHYLNIEMLTYLLSYRPKGKKNSEQVRDYTNFFWNTIENYFLGEIPLKVHENWKK